MGLDFWLLEGPERKKIRLFGVDIYPSDDDNVNIRRRRKPPKLIDFFSRERKRSRHCSSAARGRERAGQEGDEPSGTDGPWKIQKELFSTDVGINWGHLQLPKADFEAYILAFMDEEMVKQLEMPGTASLGVRLFDEDEGVVYDGMKLTHYSSSNGYVLNGAWNKICRDRGLQVKDKVGLYWDPVDKALHFSVRERAPQPEPDNA